MNMTSLKNRNQLADLLNDLKLTGEAAFIGCAECFFEDYFLQRWPGRANWIDPWRILDTPGFSGHGEETDAKQEERYQRILRKAQAFGPRCKVIRATSLEAIRQFEDLSLDFAYIDSNHSLESAHEDVDLWYDKLKPRALFAGHDYLEGMHNGQLYGVKQAVDEFAAKIGVTVNVTPETWPSWYFLKP